MDPKLSSILETISRSRKGSLTQHLASMIVSSELTQPKSREEKYSDFYFRLYDSDGSVMETFCGDTAPPLSYVSVANKMTVEFTSDVDTEMAGFIAYWDRVPPNGTLSGFIQSPGYPNRYEDCSYERWVIQATKVMIA